MKNDQKLPVDTNGGGTDFYSPIVLSAQDYYPFGMLMPERINSSGNYKYGFGGHEKDDEIKGSGNHLSFGDYGYDTRLGQRWQLDPVPVLGISGYSAFKNNPILYSDPDGKFPIIPLLIKAASGLAAAGIEAGVQFSVAYSQPGATVTSAIKKLDAADIGVAFVEGATTNGTSIPKILTRAAVIEGVKAGVDYEAGDIASGKRPEVTELIGGNKKTSETLIDYGAGMSGTKSSAKIISGLEKGVANDIKSGTFSTLNKSEKQTLRHVQNTVKSQVFKKGTEAVTDYATQGVGEGLKSMGGRKFSLDNLPASATPSDNTRVAKPIIK